MEYLPESDQSEYQRLPRLMTVKETAKYLHLHYNTVYKLIYSKKLPAIEVIAGRKYMVEATEINKYLETNRTAPPIQVPAEQADE
jgi:excisionase family DNA binding protein